MAIMMTLITITWNNESTEDMARVQTPDLFNYDDDYCNFIYAYIAKYVTLFPLNPQWFFYFLFFYKRLGLIWDGALEMSIIIKSTRSKWSVTAGHQPIFECWSNKLSDSYCFNTWLLLPPKPMQAYSVTVTAWRGSLVRARAHGRKMTSCLIIQA